MKMGSREQVAIDVAPQNKDCALPTHDQRAHGVSSTGG